MSVDASSTIIISFKSRNIETCNQTYMIMLIACKIVMIVIYLKNANHGSLT